MTSNCKKTASEYSAAVFLQLDYSYTKASTPFPEQYGQ